MKLNEKIAEVRNVLGDDASKISHLLQDLESGFEGLSRDLKSANTEISRVNAESAERRIKLREVNDLLTDKDDQIKKLSNNEEFNSLKEQNELLLGFKSKIIDERRTSLTKTLSNIAEHPDFEKLKSVTNLPEPSEEGFDLSKLDENEIMGIANKVNEYRGLGLFGEAKPNNKTPGQNFTGTKGDENNYFGYSSPLELMKKDPEKYKEYARSKGYNV